MVKKGIKAEDIKNLYEQGFNIAEIAEQLHCCSSNISHRLHKMGYTIVRDYSKTRFSRTNKHEIDLTFFENIDNQDKAYFLGIMFSDGSVSDHQFYLKMKDEDVVLKFKEALKCDYPIRFHDLPYTNYILEISSKKMCNDLKKLGCTPNKTRILRFPIIKENLIPHFIRGFFDGDGCLQLNDKLYHCRFDLTSASLDFLNDIRPYITAIAKTNGSLNKEHNYNVWHLSYSGHQVIQILNWIYKGAHYYMQRKYFKYQLLSSHKTG